MIKKFGEYNETFMDKLRIKHLCNKYAIDNYEYDINDDGSVDVYGGPVDLRDKKLKFYLPIKFGKVDGSFSCAVNKLVSLNGSPKEVGGWFDCSGNNLTTLIGGPKSVIGGINFSYNNIYSLEGHPTEISGWESERMCQCAGNPVDEILNLFKIYIYDDWPIWKVRQGGLYRSLEHELYTNTIKVILSWDLYKPVRNINGKWVVFDHRLRELFLDVTDKEFPGDFPKFKNYIIDKS